MAKSLKQLFSCIALFPHFQMNLSLMSLRKEVRLELEPKKGLTFSVFVGSPTIITLGQCCRALLKNGLVTPEIDII